MKSIVVILVILLTAGGIWMGGRQFQKIQAENKERQAVETRLLAQEPATRQKLETVKQQVNFKALEPGVVPAGFYLTEFIPLGAYAEQNILTFHYQSADGIIFSVYERSFKYGENLLPSEPSGWSIIEKIQVQGGKEAYYLGKEESETLFPGDEKNPEVAFLIKTSRVRFVVNDLLIELTSMNAAGGTTRSVLSKQALLEVARSFPP